MQLGATWRCWRTTPLTSACPQSEPACPAVCHAGRNACGRNPLAQLCCAWLPCGFERLPSWRGTMLIGGGHADAVCHAPDRCILPSRQDGPAAAGECHAAARAARQRAARAARLQVHWSNQRSFAEHTAGMQGVLRSLWPANSGHSVSGHLECKLPEVPMYALSLAVMWRRMLIAYIQRFPATLLQHYPAGPPPQCNFRSHWCMHPALSRD